MSDPLRGTVTGIVGPAHVLADPDLRAPFETDWTGRFTGGARFVVRPADTGQVAAVVRACADAGVPVVPQGGNTGLVGGATPRGGEVVVSLTRLDRLGPVDRLAGDVEAGAGVTLAALQRHAAASGLAFAVDFAARDSATVGGMVATNAGGLHVLRYGMMRAQVVGVEAVLADGRVLRWLPGLPKDNTGYHLPGLLTGSEGTLAVVTAARLRLVPRWSRRVTALLGVGSTAEALELATRLRAGVSALEAAELCFADGMELVRAHAALPAPLPGEHPAYLLVEAAGHEDPTGSLAAVLEGAAEVRDAAVAVDRPDRERLWAYRERHTEAISAAGVPHKLDVTLPLPELAAFERALRDLLGRRWPDARLVLFGHVGDGNLHVNVLGPDPADDAVDDAVLHLVAQHRGSISAEHGIGRAKARWLHLTRGDADRAVMRAVKQALDPRGVLNPGVLFTDAVGAPGASGHGNHT